MKKIQTFLASKIGNALQYEIREALLHAHLSTILVNRPLNNRTCSNHRELIGTYIIGVSHLQLFMRVFVPTAFNTYALLQKSSSTFVYNIFFLIFLFT